MTGLLMTSGYTDDPRTPVLHRCPGAQKAPFLGQSTETTLKQRQDVSVFLLFDH